MMSQRLFTPLDDAEEKPSVTDRANDDGEDDNPSESGNALLLRPQDVGMPILQKRCAPIRVSLLTSWGVRCGIATYSENLVRGLASADIDVDVLEIDRFTLASLSRREITERFRSTVVGRSRSDVVHVQHDFGLFAGSYDQEFSNATLAGVLQELSGVPTVVTFHTAPERLPELRLNAPDLWRTVGKRSRRLALHYTGQRLPAPRVPFKTIGHLMRRTGAVGVAHASHTRRQLVEAGLPAAQMHIIPHGTIPPLGTGSVPNVPALKAELGLPRESKVLTIFGFVASYKGYESALRALKLLPREYVLLVAGGPHPEGDDDTFSSLLKTSKSDELLERRIVVTGYLDFADIHKVCSVTDYFIAPYEWASELSSSGAITWALASGRPVIASAIDAFRELGNRHGAVKLFKPSSEYELAAAVTELSTDQPRAARLVEAASTYARANDWPTTGERHRALYEHLLEGRRS